MKVPFSFMGGAPCITGTSTKKTTTTIRYLPSPLLENRSTGETVWNPYLLGSMLEGGTVCLPCRHAHLSQTCNLGESLLSNLCLLYPIIRSLLDSLEKGRAEFGLSRRPLLLAFPCFPLLSFAFWQSIQVHAVIYLILGVEKGNYFLSHCSEGVGLACVQLQVLSELGRDQI